MSTAGKVLTVLIALVAVVWVLMAATVAQHNRNGTKQVEDLKKQIVDLTEQIEKAKVEIRDTEDLARQTRFAGLDALTVSESRYSEVQKKRAQEVETKERVTLQFKRTADTVKAAEQHSQQRLAERDAETQAKADAEKLVEQLKLENARLLAELTSLRDKFRAALQANREMVQRLLRDGNPVARPASFVQ